MSQVGTIKGYHDGATYSLANIYDENLAQYNEASTVFVFHFDTSEGCIDEANLWNDSGSSVSIICATVNDSKTYYPTRSGYTSLKTFDDLKTAILPFVTSENAKFDYALQFSSSSAKRFEFDFSGYQRYYFGAGGVFTFEMWHSFPPTLSRDTGLLWRIFIGNNYIGKSLLTHDVNYSYADNIPKILGVELPANTFNAPFHLAEVLSNYGKTINTFVNGSLIKTSTSTHSTASSSFIQISRIYIGNALGFEGALSELRLSKSTQPRYTNNFSVPTEPFSATIPVQGNMLIRHNGANSYIPLTSNKSNTSTPCLAVRHRNTNYYAIK